MFSSFQFQSNCYCFYLLSPCFSHVIFHSIFSVVFSPIWIHFLSSLSSANLHSMFGMWQEPDMQALQISLFLKQLHEFITSLQKNGPVPWIVSGDFNTYPHFPLYNIISTGNVTKEGLEKLNPNRYKYPQVVEKIKVRM